ncbi:MAG: hypothetical protein AAFQ50_11835, partial [Pseudomonadota bacterium]
LEDWQQVAFRGLPPELDVPSEVGTFMRAGHVADCRDTPKGGLDDVHVFTGSAAELRRAQPVMSFRLRRRRPLVQVETGHPKGSSVVIPPFSPAPVSIG